MLKKESSGISKMVSDMKAFYESKNMGGVGSKVEVKAKEGEKKDKKEEGHPAIHMCRDRVVTNLLEEFHSKAYSYPGLRFII